VLAIDSSKELTHIKRLNTLCRPIRISIRQDLFQTRHQLRGQETELTSSNIAYAVSAT